MVDFFEASTLGMDFSIEVFMAEDDMKGCKAK